MLRVLPRRARRATAVPAHISLLGPTTPLSATRNNVHLPHALTCRRVLIRAINYAAGIGETEQPGIDDHPVVKIVWQKAKQRERLLSELSEEMSSKEDIERIRKIRTLEPVHNAWEKWKRERKLLDENLPLLTDPDPDFRTLALADDTALRTSLTRAVSTTFPRLLLQDDANGTKHLGAMVELKAGVGGAESSLFCEEMLRMYERVAGLMGPPAPYDPTLDDLDVDSGGSSASSSNAATTPKTPKWGRWQVSVAGRNVMEGGGLREGVLEVKGEGAYDALRWESGVHRVQRVPATETGGRTHTSTVAVVVLPLIEEDTDTAKSDDLFSMSDIKLEVMRARGAGGQHVNKTESAVRLTHIPTGITVSMQDERSQHQNRRRAFMVLRARLLERKLGEEERERRAVRRNLVKGADRSEKVRTYNFAQDRVTDHRIGFSVKNVEGIMEGEALIEMLDKLKEWREKEALELLLEEGEEAEEGNTGGKE